MLKKLLLLLLTPVVVIGCSISSYSPSSTDSPSINQTSTPAPTLTPTIAPTPLPQVRLENAEKTLFSGDYKASLAEYEKAFQTSSNPEIQAVALKGLSQSYLAMGDCSSALTFLSTIQAQYTQSSVIADSYYLSGICYETQSQYASAIQAYQAYLQIRPDLLPVQVNEKIGDLQVALSNHTTAIQFFTFAVEQADSAMQDALKIKIAKSYKALSDYTNAISTLWDVYNLTSSDYTKATVNLYLGQTYLEMGEPEQAYARYLDSVTNFPRSYDSYSQLVELVNTGIPVPDLDRGIVDYYAGLYGYAIDALHRYINTTPDHAGEAHFFLGVSYFYISDYDNALAQYDQLIVDHSEDRFWTSAWDEKAYLLWHEKDQYEEAAQVLLDFVALIPDSTSSSDFLFEAGRIFERGNILKQAASTWERLISEYPQSDRSLAALFLAGISHYRLADYDKALLTFQRYIVLTDNAEEQSSAHFWMGKIFTAQNDLLAAQTSWRTAQSLDPTGYYGIRSSEMITQKNPFETTPVINLNTDLLGEKSQAEYWLRQTFNLDEEVNLRDTAALEVYPAFQRGNQYFSLGLYEKASEEFSSLGELIALDASLSYVLMNHLLDLQLYRQAIIICRQILDMVFSSDQATLSAPIYFNHIRFGLYFPDLVELSAQNYGFNSLLIYSLIRQESLFEGHAVSSAGAIGLMQIMPATGAEIASNLNWPAGYTSSDLERPVINIPMGVSYLARQRDYFDFDLVAALAAYNGGPGNAIAWQALANNDSDLFVEVIRFDETRQYIKQISEFYWIYQQLYSVQ